jgi:hypothetical protein
VWEAKELQAKDARGTKELAGKKRGKTGQKAKVGRKGRPKRVNWEGFVAEQKSGGDAYDSRLILY